MHSSPLPFRAIAFDLDGTLLSPSGQLSTLTLNTIREIGSQGIKIILASGRMAPRIFPIAKEIGLPISIIAFNGAETLAGQGENWTSKEIHPINDKTRDLVFDLCCSRRCFLNVYADGKLFGYHPDRKFKPHILYREQTGATYAALLDNLDSLPQHKIAKLLVVDTAENRNQLHDEWLPLLALFCSLVKSNPEYLEFVKLGVNKGAALERWLCSNSLSKEELLAFGDAENDLEMLTLAGMGIAMANATQGLRSRFQRISPLRNDEDGVAHELQQIFKLSSN